MSNVLQSKINDNKYLWIRVPKTASRAYSQLFFNTIENHHHMPYQQLVHIEGNYPGVAVIRNPHDRFVSAMHHFFDIVKNMIEKTNGEYLQRDSQFLLPCDDTTKFCQFFYQFYDKNFIPKNRQHHNTILQTNAYAILPFFKAQTHVLDGENILTFKYENLPEFHNWIETELGMDTSKIQRVGKIDNPTTFEIDLKSDEVKALVKYLFDEDYTRFNYL